MNYPFLIAVLLFSLPTFVAAESASDSEFYQNDGANIEFRIVIDVDDQSPWIILQDREGAPHKVSKKVVIGSEDISGFTIEGENLQIHFQPNSWWKVRKLTAKLIGKQLAFVKTGIILLSPRINETVSRTAQVSLLNNKGWVKWLLQDFSIRERPAHLDSDQPYEQFLAEWIDIHPEDKDIRWSLVTLKSKKMYEKYLSDWIETHPNDMGIKRELAHHYIRDENAPEVDNALPLFQSLAKENPSDALIQSRLMQCYVWLEQNEKALEIGEHALLNATDFSKVTLHQMISSLHYEMGNKNNAIKSLERSLELLRESKYPEQDPEFAAIPELRLPTKEEMIQAVTNRLEYIKAH